MSYFFMAALINGMTSLRSRGIRLQMQPIVDESSQSQSGPFIRLGGSIADEARSNSGVTNHATSQT